MKPLTYTLQDDPFIVGTFQDLKYRGGDNPFSKDYKGSTENLRYAKPDGAAINNIPTVTRDLQNNFYIDGRHLELPEFQSLGINADFVRPGESLPLEKVVEKKSKQINVGDQTFDLSEEETNLLREYANFFNSSGLTLNPQVALTPEKVAEFTARAEREINPFYQTQSRLARQNFLRDVGYSTENLDKFETDLEKKYGLQLRNIGEQAAEKGFAQSGIRNLEEERLAQETQGTLNQKRRELSFGAETDARKLAEQYGGVLGERSPLAPSISETPQILPGQEKFQRTGARRTLYELPSDLTDLISQTEFERRGALQNRIAEQETALRQQRTI